MLKLTPRSEVKSLNDSGAYGCKYQLHLLIFGGIPFGLIAMVPAITNANAWQYTLAIILGAVWYGLVGLVVTDRTRDKHIESEKQHHCPNCGYSLVGITIPQCPECGVVFTNFDPEDYKAQD